MMVRWPLCECNMSTTPSGDALGQDSTCSYNVCYIKITPRTMNPSRLVTVTFSVLRMLSVSGNGIKISRQFSGIESVHEPRHCRSDCSWIVWCLFAAAVQLLLLSPWGECWCLANAVLQRCGFES